MHKAMNVLCPSGEPLQEHTAEGWVTTQIFLSEDVKVGDEIETLIPVLGFRWVEVISDTQVRGIPKGPHGRWNA